VWLAICSAKETVCLRTGFCLDVDSHTQQADVLVFRVGSGTLEFSASDVTQIRSVPNAQASDARNSSAPQPERTLNEVLADAARAEGLPPELVRSVARVESGFRQKAVSSRGAIGLMQLMPATAAGLGIDPNRAVENAHGGAMYLRSLLLRYHGDSALALAAYNAGPGAVKRFGGVPPYEETRRYVVGVLKEYARQHKLEPKTAAGATRASTPSATD
jgi:soluble lytic murein transglycosylase-like protein